MIVATQTAKPKSAPVVRRLRRQERGFDAQGAPENPDIPLFARGSEVDADLGEQCPVFKADAVAFRGVQVTQVEARVVQAFAVVGADDCTVAEQVLVGTAVVGHDQRQHRAGANGEAAAYGHGVAR